MIRVYVEGIGIQGEDLTAGRRPPAALAGQRDYVPRPSQPSPPNMLPTKRPTNGAAW